MKAPVSSKLAKLLKEKGFEQKDCKDYYLENGLLTTMPFTDYINSKTVGAAPTIAEIVMWLYEKHGIWISVFNDDVKFFWMGIILKTKERLRDGNAKEFESPTEAYEAAIEYCLTKLI